MNKIPFGKGGADKNAAQRSAMSTMRDVLFLEFHGGARRLQLRGAAIQEGLKNKKAQYTSQRTGQERERKIYALSSLI